MGREWVRDASNLIQQDAVRRPIQRPTTDMYREPIRLSAGDIAVLRSFYTLISGAAWPCNAIRRCSDEDS